VYVLASRKSAEQHGTYQTLAKSKSSLSTSHACMLWLAAAALSLAFGSWILEKFCFVGQSP
jgi:hypothetical protein